MSWPWVARNKDDITFGDGVYFDRLPDIRIGHCNGHALIHFQGFVFGDYVKPALDGKKGP